MMDGIESANGWEALGWSNIGGFDCSQSFP